ncbi:MAG: hypothetical protein VYE15_08495 [Myxococcota bacterium]|nr:hypothetical protein [Myxococcota bacterium]
MRLRGDETVVLAFSGTWSLFWGAYLQAAHSAGVPLVMWASASIFIAYGLWAVGRLLGGALARGRRAYVVDQDALVVTDTRTDRVVLRVDRSAISDLSVEGHRGGAVTLWGRVGEERATPLIEMVSDVEGALALLAPPEEAGG